MSNEMIAGAEGRCSVAMWQMGCPAGTCDRRAFGAQYNDPFLPPHWAYNKENRPPLALGYCCDHHGGPSETGTRFMRDGNMWCAFRPGFENLQESIAGFGETQAKAYDDMAARIASDIANAKADTAGCS